MSPRLTTDEILLLLQNGKEIDEIEINWRLRPLLKEYLRSLLKASNYKCLKELAARACIDPHYLSMIMRGVRAPGRDTLLSLAFALGLNIENTQRLLTIGERNILYTRVRRDAIIIYCLIHKLSLDEAEDKLAAAGERRISHGF